MGEQGYQGTLASGGAFVADGQGIRILDPSGNQLAHFVSDVISGVSRDGQVVTIDRHNDTIVTLTAASITDAVGFEQYVRDTFVSPPVRDEPPAPESATPEPSLAFDAFDESPATDEPLSTSRPRPPIISRTDPDSDTQSSRPAHDLPEPVPTTPRSAAADPPSEHADATDAEKVSAIPPQPAPTQTVPSAPPPPVPPPALTGTEEEGGGRRLWLWGCLGCGGLIVLAIICAAIVLATGAIDVDELTSDDSTPTPFIIVATEPESGNDPTATVDQRSSDESTPVPPPDGVLVAGDSGTLNGLQVTFLGSRTDDGGVIPPDDGNEYLILSFNIDNTNAEPVTISTILQFALDNDTGGDFGIALFADIENSLDAEVPAGESLEGEVAFEVPQDSGPYVISFEDLVSDETIEWVVNQ